MSKTSDVVEPVLDDIFENIQLEVKDIEDTTNLINPCDFAWNACSNNVESVRD